jgi:hypothetical protein
MVLPRQRFERQVMAAIPAHRAVAPLLSEAHIPVDGTLITAWASMKRFKPKVGATPPAETRAVIDRMPRNSRRHRKAQVGFKGEKRSDTTHASTTDPDARLYKNSPGTGAMLCPVGHTLMDEAGFCHWSEEPAAKQRTGRAG